MMPQRASAVVKKLDRPIEDGMVHYTSVGRVTLSATMSKLRAELRALHNGSRPRGAPVLTSAQTRSMPLRLFARLSVMGGGDARAEDRLAVLGPFVKKTQSGATETAGVFVDEGAAAAAAQPPRKRKSRVVDGAAPKRKKDDVAAASLTPAQSQIRLRMIETRRSYNSLKSSAKERYDGGPEADAVAVDVDGIVLEQLMRRIASLKHRFDALVETTPADDENAAD